MAKPTAPHAPQATPDLGNYAALAGRLTEMGYYALFGEGEDAIDSIWNKPGAPQALSALAVDPESPALARFLAAEIMFAKESAFPPAAYKPTLGSVYATALAQNFTQAANPWGMPGEFEGLVADHVVTLGRSALPALAALLDDETRVDYAGSEEATLGRMHGYRVKDLAASLIGRINKSPVALDVDPNERDKTIAKLKRSLKK